MADISFRLSDTEDKDIQKALHGYDNKTKRVKELIRKGIEAEIDGDRAWLRQRAYNRAVIRRSDGSQSPIQKVPAN